MHSNESPWLIFGSIISALMLSIVPLPHWAEAFRPEWVALVLVYWSIETPERFGPGSAWLLGLTLDVLKGSLLGQYALAMAILSYLTLQLHQRLRLFPLWQQAISLGMLIFIMLTIVFLIRGLTTSAPSSLSYWTPLFTTMILWPWITLLLSALRNRVRRFDF